jgi:ABC-2 type transport system ATP-binding protein
MKNTTPLVKAERLTKLFDQHKAVDGIDFEIHPGEVVGFLGPNGAGKTTTIRMMLNLLTPTSGTLTLFGMTYARNRADILRLMNASSGTLTLPGKLSVVENLKVFADLYGIRHAKKRIDELLNKFDLKELQNRSLYSLSTGQQVRVSLAKAFINSPHLLLLDEPTSSLDPDVADRVRSFLMQVVKDEETTVFLTSHNMMEVGKICSRILFLNQGKIQVEGSPRELARRIKRWKIFLKTKKPLQQLPHARFSSDLQIIINSHEVSAEMDQDQVGPFLTKLAQDGVELESVSIHEPTLEDFFVQSARVGTPHE